MPRQTRVKSESGIYHVMIRGISQTQLFYDDADREAFIERLSRYKKECGVSVLAWCLMGNHAHLLIKEGESGLSAVMKRLALSYSHYFNAKYDRVGYLFQDRFKSKPVESDEYLLAVVRYIHRNPLEAGRPMSSWTSYSEYLGYPRITETDTVLGIFNDDIEKSRREFKKFVEVPEEESFAFLEAKPSNHMSDSKAIELILEVSGRHACTDLCTLSREEINAAVADLRSKGLSIRQISRLTGISRGIVAAAKPNSEY